MVTVEGGTFTIGKPSKFDPNAKIPANAVPHTVKVDSFFISKTEISNAQYASVKPGAGMRWGGATYPLSVVTWYEAVELCNALSLRDGFKPAYAVDKTKGDPSNTNPMENDPKWVVTLDPTSDGYRLPTEAEWEWAARGGRLTKDTVYAGSNSAEEVGDISRPRNVGEGGLPNELGIYNMSGNIAEWCWDWDGPYSSASETNPKGLRSGQARVVRGGEPGWGIGSWTIISRGGMQPNLEGGVGFGMGFRVARSILK